MKTLEFNISSTKLRVGALTGLVLLVFGGVVTVAAMNPSGETAELVPSPSPNTLPKEFANAKDEGTIGAPPQAQDFGPLPQTSIKPKVKASPSPEPSPSPSPELSESPTPSPSPSSAPASSSSDNSSPEISDIKSEDIKKDEATIKWKTNKDADSKVMFRKEGSSDDWRLKEDSSQTKEHSIKLTGLETSTNYKYKVISKDNNGNSKESSEQAFKTSDS